MDWLQRRLGAAGGSEETNHHRNKNPQSLLKGVRREGGMRMGCVPVAELGPLGSSFHQRETAEKERIEKQCSEE